MSGQDFATCEQTSVATTSPPGRARAALARLVRVGLDVEGLDVALVPDPDRPGHIVWLGPIADIQAAVDLVGDLAQALGLTPTPPPRNPGQRWERDRRPTVSGRPTRVQAGPHATRDREGRFTP